MFVPFVPSGLNPGDKYHVAFVSEGARDALSSNIADYDAFVQGEAQRTGAITESWGVTWFAIASTAGIPRVDARDHIPVTTAPMYLLSDVRLADDAADLWDGTIQTPFSVDQFGNTPSESTSVWTGTQSDGAALQPPEDFLPRNALGDEQAEFGLTTQTSGQWVAFLSSPTDMRYALYAVSEELTVIPVPAAVWLFGSGLVAFGAIARRRKQTA